MFRAGIEKPHWRPAHNLPTAWPGQRVDAAPAAGDTDRTRLQPHAWLRPARYAPRRIEAADKCKPGSETEHIDPVLTAGMAFDERVSRHAKQLADLVKVGTLVPAIADGHFDKFSRIALLCGPVAQRGRHPSFRFLHAYPREIKLRNAALDASDTLEPLPGLAQVVSKCLRLARVRAFHGNQVVAAQCNGRAHGGRVINRRHGSRYPLSRAPRAQPGPL